MAEQVESLEETVKKKLREKYDVKLEAEVKEWMEGVLGKKMDENMSFQENLKSGVFLCEVLNAISPGLIKKVNTSKLAFKQMENIVSFLQACQKLGFGAEQLFDTIDLFENKDPNKVLINLSYLRQHHDEFRRDPAILELTLSAFSPPAQARRLSDSKSPVNTSGGSTGSSGTTSPSSSGFFGRSGSRTSVVVSPVPFKGSSSFSPTPTEPMKQQSPGGAEVKKAPAVPSVQNLGADVALKEELKYNHELERMATRWICDVVGTCVPSNTTFADFLKDGIHLCKLMNVVQPNSIPKIHTGNIAFQKIENIGNYIGACKKLGLVEQDLFDIIDLFEEKNINYVINHVHVLAKHVAHLPTYKGPQMEQEDLSKTRNLFSANLTSNFIDFHSNDGAEEMTEDQQDLLAWVNGIFMNCMPPQPSIQNLSSNMRSGKVIIKLLEELTHHPVGTVVEDPKTMWHCMENALSIIRFLTSETCETVSVCSARDIASGNIERIAALLEYIRDKFDLEYVFANLLGGQLDDSEVLEIMTHYNDTASTSPLSSVSPLSATMTISPPPIQPELASPSPLPARPPSPIPEAQPAPTPVEPAPTPAPTEPTPAPVEPEVKPSTTTEPTAKPANQEPTETASTAAEETPAAPVSPFAGAKIIDIPPIKMMVMEEREVVAKTVISPKVARRNITSVMLPKPETKQPVKESTRPMSMYGAPKSEWASAKPALVKAPQDPAATKLSTQPAAAPAVTIATAKTTAPATTPTTTTPTPTPTATASTPATTTPNPAKTTPSPATTTPSPAKITPTPATTAPTPATTTPTPAATTPTPAATTPTPATTTPTPAATTPTPAATTPTPATATPTQSTPTPSTTQAKAAAPTTKSAPKPLPRPAKLAATTNQPTPPSTTAQPITPSAESTTQPANLPAQPANLPAQPATSPSPAAVPAPTATSPTPAEPEEEQTKYDVKSRLSIFEQVSKPAAKPIAKSPVKPHAPPATSKPTAQSSPTKPAPTATPAKPAPATSTAPSTATPNAVPAEPTAKTTPTSTPATVQQTKATARPPSKTDPPVPAAEKGRTKSVGQYPAANLAPKVAPATEPSKTERAPTEPTPTTAPTEPAATEPTPIEPTPTPTEPTPAEPTPAEPIPTEPTPTESTPTESIPTPTEPTPTEPTPTELPPTEPTPTEPIPTEPTPTEPTPTEPTPTEPIPTEEPTPTESALPEPIPTEPTPTEPTPTELTPVEPKPAEPAPIEPAHIETPELTITPVEPTPAEPTPTEPTPAEPTPAEPTPAEPTPAEPTPAEPTPAEPTPAEPTPAEPTPAEPTPTEPTPTEPTPTEPTPTEPTPTEPAPTKPTPSEPTPVEPTPTEPTPAEPAEPTPAEPTPTEPTPAEPTPVEPTLVDSTPAEPTPAEPTPVEPTPAEATPAEPTPEPTPTPITTEPTPTESAPEPTPAEPTPTKPTPVEPEKTEAPGPRKISFALPPESEKKGSEKKGSGSGVEVEIGDKVASISVIPTSPRTFVNGRTLRRMKVSVDENGDYQLGKLSPRSATVVNQQKIATAQYLMRKRIATEILTTERSYIKSLQTVMQLLETVKTSKSLNEVEFYTVFANLPEVLQYHINFMKIIEYSIADTWRDMTAVSEIFEQFDYMATYSKYILNYNKCCVTLHQLRKRNQPFKRDVEEFEMIQRKGTGLHNLDAYLVMPVQRVPRYLLLLRDLHKYTPSTHPDHFLLPGIIDLIQSKLDQINASITPGELEEIRKIVMIDESIDHMTETLFRPNRKYIREGHLVLKLKSHNTNFRASMSVSVKTVGSLSIFKKKSHHVAPMWFLFTDVLIYCEKKQHPEGGKLFDFVSSLNISDISEVREKINYDNKKKSKKGYTRAFGFGLLVDNVDWVFYASSEEEKRAWVNDLIILLLQHKKRQIQEGARSASTSIIPRG